MWLIRKADLRIRSMMWANQNALPDLDYKTLIPLLSQLFQA